MPEIEYHIGDCRSILKDIPSESVNCCVTSPPYYGLRSYNNTLQVGLESSPEAYVAELVLIFREIRRILKPDGTLWLNLGDCYWGGKGKSGYQLPHKIEKRYSEGKTIQRAHTVPGYMEMRPTDGKHPIIKPKDLVGFPWRTAFALQKDGWYLRQDIIWEKSPVCKPESVKDRCTQSHEYIFLLSKSQHYHFDYKAIMEEAAYDGRKDTVMKGSTKYKDFKVLDKKEHTMAARGHERWQRGSNGEYLRNKRSVWKINPAHSEHIAAFPMKLVEPCVLAGCPEGGTVIDPFAGSGTVGKFCKDNYRNAILIELNPEYEPLIRDSTDADVAKLSSFFVSVD